MSAGRRPRPLDPALRAYAQQRAHDAEDRFADSVTAFAGSMRFVYLHLIWFTGWIGLGAEEYPYGLLTMVVSLESIFLTTFVMISQNRSDERSQVLADDRWQRVLHREQRIDELPRAVAGILELTRSAGRAEGGHADPGPGASASEGRGRSSTSLRARDAESGRSQTV